MSLTLTNIPKIMRSKGWNRGAALMERWFRNPPTQLPGLAASDTTTITMSWILGFQKPKSLYDSMFNERIWANDAAKKLMKDRLNAWGMLGSVKRTFDQTTQTPAYLENHYVNFRGYGGGYSGYSGSGYSGSGYSGSGYSGAAGELANQYSGTSYGGLNDLIAAMGAFTFRVVVGGSVEPTGGGHRVTIEKVGVYVRDSYDFEGFQFLGFWDDSDNSVSVRNPLSGTAVFNSSFRDWRKKNGAGGDFKIFTNVLTTQLSSPTVFNI